MRFRKNLFLMVGIYFFLFSGFEKAPAGKDTKPPATMDAWMNETANLTITEAFREGDTVFVCLESVLRESDRVRYLYAKTSAAHKESPNELFLTLTTEKDYLENKKHPGIKILTKKEKKAISRKFEIVNPNASQYQSSALQNGIKTVNQMVLNSHVFGLVTRPVSSSFRLVTWMGSTAEDVLLQDISHYFENEKIPPLYQGKGMDLPKFEERLNQLFGDNRANGTLKLYIGGEAYFDRQIAAFKEAKKSIDVRIFIFDNDDFGVHLADILKKRSQDIPVRVLLDGVGMLMGEGKVSDTLPPGFVPPSSMVGYLQNGSNVHVRVRPNAWFKADHTKTVFIDDKICFTGGMNFGREYRYDWHDLMMELRGPIVQKLYREFEIAWAHAGKLGDLAYLRSLIMVKERKSDFKGGFPIRPLYTTAREQQIYKAQIEAIQHAKRYIYISNAYFSDNAIVYELIRARRRGVDVRVILPVHGNHDIMNKSNIVTADVMYKNGIRVYFYPGMSHVKAAIYDGWLCTGSANFDKLSFRDNLELNIATSDPATVQEFKEKLFEADFKKSTEMTKPIATDLEDHLANFLAGQL